MLSCFSHVRLFVTPWTIACQAPLSMIFPRQEYWEWYIFNKSDLKRMGICGYAVKDLIPDLKFPLSCNLASCSPFWFCYPVIPLQQAVLWGQWASSICSLSSRPLWTVSFTTGTVLLLIPANFSIRSSSGGHGRREPDWKVNGLSLTSEVLSSSSDQHFLDV